MVGPGEKSITPSSFPHCQGAQSDLGGGGRAPEAPLLPPSQWETPPWQSPLDRSGKVFSGCFWSGLGMERTVLTSVLGCPCSGCGAVVIPGDSQGFGNHPWDLRSHLPAGFWHHPSKIPRESNPAGESESDKSCQEWGVFFGKKFALIVILDHTNPIHLPWQDT